MKIEKLLKRLKIEFVKVNIIQSSLDTLIFFLASNLLLFIFSIDLSYQYSNAQLLTVLSLFFLFGNFIYRARNYHLELYEEKNPELKEVLRTARDNLDKKTVASQALFDDLVDRARSITSESIIPSKSILQKIFMISLLSFVTVFSGLTDARITSDTGGAITDFMPIESAAEDEDVLVRDDDSIYGDQEVINLSELNIEIDISGDGESVEGNPEEFIDDSKTASLDSVGPRNEIETELAKKYSLAVRELDNN